MFKGLTNFANIVSQARSLGEKMQSLNDDLRTRRAIGRADDELVAVEVDGLGTVLNVRLDPRSIASGDVARLEASLRIAINDALTKAKDLHAVALQSVTSGLNLDGLNPSGLSEMMGKLPTQT
ncbi:MAG: YbaB/EbfC family nucleoid-associated protein [Pirellulales bacterium]